MAFKQYERYHSTVDGIKAELQKLQHNIEEAFRSITSKDHLDSSLISSVSLTSGVDNLIAHKQGKAIRGWQVLSLDTNAVIYENTSTTEDKTKYLVLNTTTTCTCKLVVFV